MDQTRKAQVGAEPTTEERKHLEECRREEMELLKGKGGSPESEAEERGDPAHTIKYAVKVSLPHIMVPAYRRFMDAVVPQITNVISDEISRLLSAFYEAIEEHTKGGAK